MDFDWGKAGTGALSGAATGATVGGPVGALGGGVLGSLLGFTGSGDKMNKVSTLSKPQKALLDQIMQMISPGGQLGQSQQQGISLLNQYMNPSSEAVQQFTQPYMDQFNNQIVPGLAERFAGRGALGGALSSSGFGQSLSAAGGQLQNQLAALKAGLGQQAAQSLMNQYGSFAGMGLNAQPFAYLQKAPSAFSGFMQGYGQEGMPGLGQAGQGLSNWWSNNGPIIGNV